MIKTTVGIDGMMCNMCEAHMNEAIRNNFKVKKVSASHTAKNAEILSEEALDEEKLKQVVEETGYTFISCTSEPVEKLMLEHLKKFKDL